MNELSRTLIEQYCWSHNSKKSRQLEKLVEMSYDPGCMPTDEEDYGISLQGDGLQT